MASLNQGAPLKETKGKLVAIRWGGGGDQKGPRVFDKGPKDHGSQPSLSPMEFWEGVGGREAERDRKWGALAIGFRWKSLECDPKARASWNPSSRRIPPVEV